MFVGPFGPGLPGSGFVSPGATGPELAALPAGAGAAAEHPRAGRALLQLAGSGDGGGAAGIDPFAMPALPALPAAPSDAASARSARATALAVADDAAGSPEAAGKAGGGGQLAALWSATKASLWPAREALSAAQLEGLALQRLQVGAGSSSHLRQLAAVGCVSAPLQGGRARETLPTACLTSWPGGRWDGWHSTKRLLT